MFTNMDSVLKEIAAVYKIEIITIYRFHLKCSSMLCIFVKVFIYSKYFVSVACQMSAASYISSTELIILSSVISWLLISFATIDLQLR
jgi:hypothetical protein